MRSNLAVDRMTTQQLWDRAFLLIGRSMPLMNQGPKDLHVSLSQLEAVLDEIKLRGEQLELFTPPPPGPPHESARGVWHV
jgi:hypothetical protein